MEVTPSLVSPQRIVCLMVSPTLLAVLLPAGLPAMVGALLWCFEGSGQCRQSELLQSLWVCLALSREADDQLGEGISRGLWVESATAGE